MPDLMSDDEITAALETLPDWSRDGDALVRDVPVPADSRESLEQAVMNVANELNHHPDIEETGDGIRLRLSTHSAGGVTANDVELAASIDQVLSGAARDQGPEGWGGQ